MKGYLIQNRLSQIVFYNQISKSRKRKGADANEKIEIC